MLFGAESLLGMPVLPCSLRCFFFVALFGVSRMVAAMYAKSLKSVVYWLLFVVMVGDV
jgi:hypothetical protein